MLPVFKKWPVVTKTYHLVCGDQDVKLVQAWNDMALLVENQIDLSVSIQAKDLHCHCGYLPKLYLSVLVVVFSVNNKVARRCASVIDNHIHVSPCQELTVPMGNR